MDSSTSFIHGVKGQTICRPTDWVDIAKFFLLNYGLHALTVNTDPGDSAFVIFSRTLLAVFLPMTGALRAFDAIFQYARGEKDPLTVALGSGALCMVRPGVYENTNLAQVSTALTEIHGQHPVPVETLFRSIFPKTIASLETGTKKLESGHLVLVPQSLDVVPPLPDDTDKDKPKPLPSCEVELSCNYSILKATAAILQTLYASFGLYQVSGEQIKKFGYASYSLTVIPYILMSLINLLAALCQPNYPRMFLVKYGGPDWPNTLQTGKDLTHEEGVVDGMQRTDDEEITNCVILSRTPTASVGGNGGRELERSVSGEVGIAYGPLPEPSAPRPEPSALSYDDRKYAHRPGYIPPRPALQAAEAAPKERPSTVPKLWAKWTRKKQLASMVVYSALLVVWLAGPYIIVQLLTGFKKAESTTSQRAWVMIWMVFSQLMSLAPPFLPGDLDKRRVDPVRRHFQMLFGAVIVSSAAVGGFVVVIQMMRNDQVCTRI